jgi:peptide-methionine (R)-S-oxide reductase
MKSEFVRFLIILTVVTSGLLLLVNKPRAQQTQTAVNPAPLVPTPADLAAVSKVLKSDAEWKKQLTPAQFAILRGKVTERACSSVLLLEHRRGIFHCVGCGAPLFASDGKFESGTGWPSFSKPFVPGNVVTAPDHSLGMDREEVLCARCGAHLGHVFDDGPPPAGLRYCLNGVALKFEERP